MIQIKTQAEWEALPKSFDAFTEIHIVSPAGVWITVSSKPNNSHVVARGSSHVEAWESSHVVAMESSHVEARGSSHVEARESSHVVAWGSSHVEAWESSHVVARESSHVVARESSHVEAWESSHVVARGSSHVEAWGSVTVHNHSTNVHIDLFGFAVAILLVKTKHLFKKSRTTSVIEPKSAKGTSGWLESQGVKPKSKCVVFKRVSADFKTQEKNVNETLWKVGVCLEHKSWSPKLDECGSRKFHACSRPYFCDEFRSTKGDRYVAIEVKTTDLHAWPNPQYPHKVAFRKGKVLYECDKFGNKI